MDRSPITKTVLLEQLDKCCTRKRCRTFSISIRFLPSYFGTSWYCYLLGTNNLAIFKFESLGQCIGLCHRGTWRSITRYDGIFDQRRKLSTIERRNIRFCWKVFELLWLKIKNMKYQKTNQWMVLIGKEKQWLLFRRTKVRNDASDMQRLIITHFKKYVHLIAASNKIWKRTCRIRK